ncbi:MAG: ribosome small subunit-dependent GTPase A [Steroidobacteraceae bacterium]
MSAIADPADPATEVIATFGRFLLVRDRAHGPQLARPRGRNLDIVCGDFVICEREASSDELLVAGVLPRRTVLRRSNLRGRSEALAANLSLLIIVIAPVPVPDFFLVDRYLCAAACAGLEALIVMNKSDLALPQDMEAELEGYTRIGYRVLRVATRGPDSLDPLRAALAGHTAALVGQSGVGKSSLIRHLALDADDVTVGALMRAEEGRHTTTAARLYDCSHGGRIMDSPGVRDYAPAIDDLDAATLGFHDVDQLATGCRFLDCRHMQEPQCAVREAVSSGRISQRRYESYRRLRRLYETLWSRRPATEQARRPT